MRFFVRLNPSRVSRSRIALIIGICACLTIVIFSPALTLVRYSGEERIEVFSMESGFNRLLVIYRPGGDKVRLLANADFPLESRQARIRLSVDEPWGLEWAAELMSEDSVNDRMGLLFDIPSPRPVTRELAWDLTSKTRWSIEGDNGADFMVGFSYLESEQPMEHYWHRDVTLDHVLQKVKWFWVDSVLSTRRVELTR